MLSFFDMERLTRRSLLPALDYALLIAIGLAGLVALLTLIDTVTSKSLADLTIGLGAGDVGASLPAGIELNDAQGLVAARTGLGYRLAWWLAGPATSLFVLAGASVLREVVAGAQAGDPFVTANVKRVRVLAFLTAGYFAVTAARPLVAEVIEGDLDVELVIAPLSYAPLAFALALFALAEIWQRGVALRDEQQLTV
jgi:Protein of unknown function (DUF2975)